MSNNDETSPSSIPTENNIENPTTVETVTTSVPETSIAETSDGESNINETTEVLPEVSKTSEPEIVIATEPEIAVDVTPEVVAEIPSVDKEARVRELQETRLVLEREAQNLIEEISIKDESAQRFAVWVDHHQRTFLWKMLSKMNEQLDRVIEKQNEFEATVSAVDLPKPGELVRYGFL